MSEEDIKRTPSNISTTTIKILGIPVYSVKKSIEVDEDALCKKMADRLEVSMINAIEKLQVKS